MAEQSKTKQTRKNNMPVLAGLAAAVFGILLMNQQMSSRRTALERRYQRDQVWVASAARRLEAGAELSPELIGRVRMAAEPQPWSTIKLRDPDAGVESRRQYDEMMAMLSGRVLNRDVERGELILWTDLEGAGDAGLSDLLWGEHRGVAVEVDQSSMMGGLLQPNDRVDVLATYEAGPVISGEASRRVARTVVMLQDVNILAVGGRIARGMPQQRSGRTTIVLGLDPDDALALSHVQKQARISLLLRPRMAASESDYKRPHTSSDEILERLQVLPISPQEIR